MRFFEIYKHCIADEADFTAVNGMGTIRYINVCVGKLRIYAIEKGAQGMAPTFLILPDCFKQ